MQGRHCRLVALDAESHAAALHEAYSADAEGRTWPYQRYGPFDSTADYAAWVKSVQASETELFYAVEELPSGRPVGVASYLRIDPAMGCIEVLV